MKQNYFLKTGEADKQRLSILNKIYNPPALSFLQESGLQSGMTILEVGCGIGQMACELGKAVGPKGRVIAIDSSAAQIQVAKQTALHEGVTNIDFHVCKLEELESLNLNYDATYGRWVIEFIQEPEKALEVMYKCLNKNGILAYEASNMLQTAYFSYPYSSIPEEFHAVGPKNFQAHGCKIDFAKQIYHEFKKLNCKNITIKPTQGILRTSEEKMVYRLGILTGEDSLIEKNILSKEGIDDFVKRAEEFEKSESISGFYLNYLISGRK